MLVNCDRCHIDYDDAERWTNCPHNPLMPARDLERKKAALEILGKNVRFAHQPDGPTYHVYSCNFVGMVLIDGMAGEFAPHLFVVAS